MIKKILIGFGGLILVSALILYFYNIDEKPTRWAKMYVGAGSNSSPRPVDLNGDGVLDIVMGGGGAEFERTDFAVMAINGASGELLWKLPGVNQVFGSPIFKDIDQDSVPDIFIGGRSAQLLAVSGKTGQVIWQFIHDYQHRDIKTDTSLLNFYNPSFVPDQNGDGMEDLVVTFGGYVAARPEDKNRPAGKLMLFDAMHGTILSEITMPDGKECYMSPVVYPGMDGLSVIFGSGGETIGGNLYRILLDDLLHGDLSRIIYLDDGGGKGFIAPPVLSDITQDGQLDIICATMNGRLVAFDGMSNEKVWEFANGINVETQTAVVPGYFNDDEVPDFFATIGYGTWPKIDTASHLFIDGKDGTVFFRDTLGIMQLATAVTFDMDQDGRDDIVQVLNRFENDNYYDRHYMNQVYVYNVVKGKVYALGEERRGMNVGSTPLVTDLDGDGNVDFVFCYNSNDNDLTKFEHLVVERVEFNIKLGRNLWGSYMGTDYTGVFR